MIADLYAKGEHPLSERQPPRDLSGRERHQNCWDHLSNNETLDDSHSVDCSAAALLWSDTLRLVPMFVLSTERIRYRCLFFIHWQYERWELVLSKAFATFATLTSCYHSQVNIKEGITSHSNLDLTLYL